MKKIFIMDDTLISVSESQLNNPKQSTYIARVVKTGSQFELKYSELTDLRNIIPMTDSLMISPEYLEIYDPLLKYLKPSDEFLNDKTRTSYTIIGLALCCSELTEGQIEIIYRRSHDTSLFSREASEFLDKFTKIP